MGSFILINDLVRQIQLAKTQKPKGKISMNKSPNPATHLSNTRVMKLCECASMISLAVVLDLISKVIFVFGDSIWVYGGGITLAMIPIVFLALRHGIAWGIVSAFVYSLLQMLLGWYAPPAGTFIAFFECIMLDYVLAYTILGIAPLFTKLFKNKPIGYGFGAFCVCLLRFVFSALSGVIVWESTAAWGFESVLAYSFVYNISYMLPNALITSGIIIAICSVFDPVTLKKR